MSDFKILDIHCHPGLKNWLFPNMNHLWKKGAPNNDLTNNCRNQIDIPSLLQGQFRGLISAHYLPEKFLLEKNLSTGLFRGLVPSILHGQYDTFETGNPFAQVRLMMEKLEQEISDAAVQHCNVKLATSYNEFNTEWNSAVGTDKIIFVHALEGAHCLGRNLSKVEDYLMHLKIFHSKGACMMTLAHFFPNDIATGVEGIAPSFRKLVLDEKFIPDNSAMLTATGVEVVKTMFDIGMIVDLTHSTYNERDQVYSLNNARGGNRRPLIMSHTGLKSLFKPIPVDSVYKFDQYSARNEDVAAIAKCDGVIGVIMENYWLNGVEEGKDPATKIGIPIVIQTINEIKKQTGSYKNISLGTDYDGYIDAPQDLMESSDMSKLIQALEQQLGMTTTDIEDILWGNAKRVLQNGWK
ncbi:MAG: membrane dipeptidase [Bacteroidota bacterium]